MPGLSLVKAPQRVAGLFKRLGAENSGVSIVEFALVLPVLLTLGLFGTEIARMATVNMTVSQIALSLADNASRLGQTDNSGVTPTITEDNVDAVLSGALRDGQSIGLEANGRVILSSLEYDDFTGRQFIAWQRCQGDLEVDSDYGNDTDKNGLSGTPMTGMGDSSSEIRARSGQAVMRRSILLLALNDAAPRPPPCGEGQGWEFCVFFDEMDEAGATPTPCPFPQGGGECGRSAS